MASERAEMLKRVKQDGLALRYASADLKGDKEIVMEAGARCSEVRKKRRRRIRDSREREKEERWKEEEKVS